MIEHLFLLTPEQHGDPARCEHKNLWSSEEWRIDEERLDQAIAQGAGVFFFENNLAILNKEPQMSGVIVGYKTVLDNYRKIYFRRDDALDLEFFNPQEFDPARAIVRWVAS